MGIAGCRGVKPRVHLIFAALMLVMLLAALDATILATALPTIVSELGGIDRLGWVITAYLLTQTVRCLAASSRLNSRGAGSSTSTCRSGSPRWP